MKKVFLILTAGVLTLSILSCGGEKKETTEAKDAVKETTTKAKEVASDLKKDLNLEAGEAVYLAKCAACHGKDGKGIPPAFPPLANSDYLTADNALQISLNGLSGEITVNGQKYNTEMVKVDISEQEAVDVSNYILNSWGNNKGTVKLTK